MTIASAITAAQGRVANAYTAVNDMGGTIPTTQNLANLPTAIRSISTVNNQNKTFTTNGTYTADTGYTGLGTVTVALPLGPVIINQNVTLTAQSAGLQGFSEVTVNVPQGDIVTATNNTGSNIASGDKVWLEKVAGQGFVLNKFFTADVTKINTTGSLDITGGIASGFSTIKFIQVGNLALNNANSWYFETELTIGSDFSSTQAIFVENQQSYNTIFQVSSNGKLSANISKNHTSFDIGTMTTTAAISPNTPTKVKFEFSGTAYNIYINDVLECSVSSTVKLSQHIWNIGCANTDNTVYCLPYTSGYINLNKTKLYVENTDTTVTTWPIGSSFNDNGFSGFANENISSGASGEVKTILPEEVTVTVTTDANNADITAE